MSQQLVEAFEPLLPSCSHYTADEFREKFLSRGPAFNLSNAGDYVYDVSGGWDGAAGEGSGARRQAARGDPKMPRGLGGCGGQAGGQTQRLLLT